MKKYLFPIILTLILQLTIDLNSQEKNKFNFKAPLRIFVKDSLNKPIPGAIIFLDNLKQKQITDKNGFVAIKIKKTPQKISVFSPIYGIQDFFSYENTQNVIIKYNQKALKTNIGVTEQIITTENKVVSNTKFQFTNIYEYLRGRVAGVVVSSDNKILIRGTTSFNASTEPLFILNGIPISSVDDIAPSDIKSVTVLKGPETAKYGVRGSNGVILIQTY
ncbi:MAG: TonB-dependent receptor plug domain-containing protein [Flavobacteriia bacterium]|nr:TonB-dependent receptor plug domain-containing protein [Flavobacteriia bacterium]OIP46112.1 MAG: hypothetical protein AUK46_09945 [Flavobacteriaceae bacterium CG2_30_31_66]PIV96916.1 MAG: hypothetical protein COW43_05705 [Flavobacteriaceae bacterium CG17_big_fil_post_rev_8_21_14_2_50_31_13]PIX15541.1 MAG: hypothetical protein COZ74_00165 [Flavobacteriaceae bacterium CG_4_8_14_3_um_filter_31_8]PIY15222.1 MAG: hypothetical protein COZ16_05100 [Flavobacteriaceae bacterium CG_4_10_14_3_um_filter